MSRFPQGIPNGQKCAEGAAVEGGRERAEGALPRRAARRAEPSVIERRSFGRSPRRSGTSARSQKSSPVTVNRTL